MLDLQPKQKAYNDQIKQAESLLNAIQEFKQSISTSLEEDCEHIIQEANFPLFNDHIEEYIAKKTILQQLIESEQAMNKAKALFVKIDQLQTEEKRN